ncbi:O-antigen ligase family protein [Phenylobacterium sp.]|uniref:O-antigen ligase family protein n=1 Tax=Phenylobacterium sp. TaxID=1871053 RepID=UPI002F93457C
MPFDLRGWLPFCLLLAPFIYSNDNSNYRAYEVLAVGITIAVLALLTPLRMRRQAEWFIVGGYALLLIIQQLALTYGSIRFGAQYALVMIFAFAPAWAVHSIQWRPQDFAISWDFAIRLASAFLLVNLVGSRLFGFGEIASGMQGQRYFGFLGDSISPILAFPLLYFLVRRQFLWVSAMGLGMLLTGGKAALVMLVVALCLMLLTKTPWLVRLASLPVFIFVGAFASPKIMALLGSPAVQYSWNTRLLSYELGWRLFLKSPVFGVGINQSMVNLAPQADALAGSRGMTRYWIVGQIHNAFIRTMAETGVLGLIALLSLCVLLSARAFVALERVQSTPSAAARGIIVAGSVWTIAFITTYQSVGWFEHGHPQLAWLLLISSTSYAASQLYRNQPTPKRWAPARQPPAMQRAG